MYSEVHSGKSFMCHLTIVQPVTWYTVCSLLHWDTKIPQTFKFVTAVFSFVFVPPSLKCNITMMCRYKTVKQKVLEDQL